jgi:DNA-binding NarL/FixJ family response regulator
MIRESAPEIAIVDMAMRDAFELVRELRELAPCTRVIAFAIDENVSTIMDCARAGAAGYVTADSNQSPAGDYRWVIALHSQFA